MTKNNITGRVLPPEDVIWVEHNIREIEQHLECIKKVLWQAQIRTADLQE